MSEWTDEGKNFKIYEKLLNLYFSLSFPPHLSPLPEGEEILKYKLFYTQKKRRCHATPLPTTYYHLLTNSFLNQPIQKIT